MKNLIPKSAYGVFIDDKGRVMVDSRCFAKAFERPHANLCRAVADPLTEFFMSDEFKRQNYEPANDPVTNEVYYNMTLDGFYALAYAWQSPSIDKTGRIQKAMAEYRSQFMAFDRLSWCIAYVIADFPIAVDGYCKLNKYDEVHLVPNRLIYCMFKMSESEFRKSRGIKCRGRITSALTQEENELLMQLQAMDIGMLMADVPKNSRDKRLKEYAELVRGNAQYELVRGVLTMKK